MIRRIAASHEADPQLREDLAQEILCAVWRAAPSFRGDAALRTFVARIATNRAVTHVKRALARPRSAPLPDDIAVRGEDAESQAIARDRDARLLAAVRALPMALREPALLTLEGLPVAEIAKVLGVTPNAVAVRMSRAKQTLRLTLGEPS